MARTGVGDPYRNAPQDQVRDAFNQGSFQGIRSLPNSLLDLNPAGGRGVGVGGARQPAPLAVPVAAGQRRPAKLSAAPPAFTLFEYQPDEYDREKEQRRDESQDSRARMGDKATFKCTALPAVPKSAGSFNEFEYVEDPYEALQEATREWKRQSQQRAAEMGNGPQRAAGQAEDHDKAKARKWEVFRSLTKQLKEVGLQPAPTCHR
jgi:hypothetical protein